VAAGRREALLPGGLHVRVAGGAPVAADHDGRDVEETAVAAGYPVDAPGAGDLDPVVLRVLRGVEPQFRRTGDFQAADLASVVDPAGQGRRVPQPVGGHPRERVDLAGQAQEVPYDGELVVPVVEEQRSATAPGPVSAPVERGGRDLPFGRGPADIRLDADADDVADLAGLDDLLGPADRRVEDEILEDLEHDTALAGSGDHRVGVGQGDRHRLLQGHVLARVHGLEGDRRVQVMRDQDLRHVDVIARQEVAVVGVPGGFVYVPGFAAPFAVPGLRVSDRGDDRVGVRLVGAGVQAGDAAAADDADPDRHVLTVRFARASTLINPDARPATRR